MSIPHADFALRVRQLMEQRGFTQEVLAARVGTRQGMISRWLKGSWPTPPLFYQLARALGCTMEFLLIGEEAVATPRRDADPTGALLGAQAVRPKAPAARRGRRAG